MDPDDPAYPGQAEYTPRFLKVYDVLVLGVMARAVWRCPTSLPLALYRRHVGRRHLDVGPGTGYFLARTPLPPDARVTLLDPNPDVLAHAARRLHPTTVTTIEADVMKVVPPGPFDSVGLNYVIHCLPGPMLSKRAAIRNLAETLAPDGVLFGGTVLGKDHRHGWPARLALSRLNGRRVFDNRDDTIAGLIEALEERFATVQVETAGSVALFSARHPHPAAMGKGPVGTGS